MELDGYSARLKIAFEHHGQQHYKARTGFKTTRKELTRRQQDDKMKRKLCKEKNIKLIEIPEVPTLLKVDEIRNHIKRECMKRNIILPAHFDSINVALKNAYVNTRLKQGLEELRLLARQRGGKCVSGTYVHSHRKLLWECAEGHQWEGTPTNIRSGTWCPVCVGKAKLTIGDLQSIAQTQGGRCLSDAYVDNRTKLVWECSKGHRWESAASNIRSGTWCPICAGTVRLTIEEMRRIAETRGGRCLSTHYTNASTKLEWECAKGHRWVARPGKVKRGTWCPFCAGKKTTIKEMREIAASRGGKCLSRVGIELGRAVP
jgi:hypothetical protein